MCPVRRSAGLGTFAVASGAVTHNIHTPWTKNAKTGKAGAMSLGKDSKSNSHLPSSQQTAAKSQVVTFGHEPPLPARSVVADRPCLGESDERSEHERLYEPVLESGKGVASRHLRIDGSGRDREQPHEQRGNECRNHPTARWKVRHPPTEDSPLQAAEHEALKGTTNQRNDQNRKHPVILSEILRLVGRQLLERNASDHDHGEGRQVEDNPEPEQPPTPPRARRIRGPCNTGHEYSIPFPG